MRLLQKPGVHPVFGSDWRHRERQREVEAGDRQSDGAHRGRGAIGTRFSGDKGVFKGKGAMPTLRDEMVKVLVGGAHPTKVSPAIKEARDSNEGGRL